MKGSATRANSAGLLLAAFLGIGAASANAQIFGPMMGSFKQAFGWNRAEVSFGFTCVMLISPIVHVVMGLVLDRYGSRRVALPGVIAFALGTALLGLAGPALWSWYALNLSYAVLAGGVGFAVWIKAVVERFDQHRGIALAVTLSGSGLISAIMPTVVHWLLLHVALRAVYPAIALGLSVLIIVPAWLFLPTMVDKTKV